MSRKDTNTSRLVSPQYRSMSVEQRQIEYSPSSAIGGNYAPYIERYLELSERAYAECARVETVRYGNGPSQSFDIAVPDPGSTPAPVVVYIHGGYWQALSKRESFFAAKQFVDRDIAYVALGYTLAPQADLGEIVAECRSALVTLCVQAAALGVDPGRIFVAGSSAGAHLSAMSCLDAEGLMRPAGAVLLSGIYDLEPFVGISDNDAVGLSVEQAHRLSPLLLDPAACPDAIITWGEHETLEFKRQSHAMAEHLRCDTRLVEEFESPSRNHFDLVHDIADLGTPLGRHVQLLIGQ